MGDINNYIPSAYLPFSLQILTCALNPISYSKLVDLPGVSLKSKYTVITSNGNEIDLISRTNIPLDKITKMGIIEQLIIGGYLTRSPTGEIITTEYGKIKAIENTRGASTHIQIYQCNHTCTLLNPRQSLEEKVEATLQEVKPIEAVA